ncbi:MAG TPA: vitamin B12-dependent ribonucleotide reductase, partial [Nitrospiraceae bacterium]
MSTSIIDYIFRELAVTYLDRFDLAQVKEEVLRLVGMKKDEQDPECMEEEATPETLASASISTELFPSRQNVTSRHQGNGRENGASGVAHKIELKKETITYTAAAVEIARLQGYEGDPCQGCNEFKLVRNGTCLKCMGCGATSGCS